MRFQEGTSKMFAHDDILPAPKVKRLKRKPKPGGAK